MRKVLFALMLFYSVGTFVSCTVDPIDEETELATDHGDSCNTGECPPPPPPPPPGN